MGTIFEKINYNDMTQYKNHCVKETMLSPVTEAYYGKSKELLKAEKFLDEICKIVYADYGGILDIEGFANAVEKLLVSSKVRKCIDDFEKSIIKQFGFGEFQLSFFHVPWVRNKSLQNPQAITFASGIIRHMQSDMLHLKPLAQESGGYYDKTHSYSCVVAVSYELFDIRLTGGELLAIILHEIGHNFQCTPLTNIGYFAPYLSIYQKMQNDLRFLRLSKDAKAISMFITFTQLTAIHHFSDEVIGSLFKIYDELWTVLTKSVPSLMSAVNMITKIIQIFDNVITYIDLRDYFDRVTSLVFRIKRINMIDLIIAMTGYSGEVFADSFAATYGYGPELNSGLNKLNTNLRMDYNFLMDPNINPFYVIWELSFTYLEVARTILSLDPHPDTQRRLFNTMDKLQRDINSGKLPPKMKKQALKDLAESRKVYEEFLKAPKGDKQLAILATARLLKDSAYSKNMDIKTMLNRVANIDNIYS